MIVLELHQSLICHRPSDYDYEGAVFQTKIEGEFCVVDHIFDHDPLSQMSSFLALNPYTNTCKRLPTHAHTISVCHLFLLRCYRILPKHSMLQAFSFLFSTSLVHFSLMWVTDCIFIAILMLLLQWKTYVSLDSEFNWDYL